MEEQQGEFGMNKSSSPPPRPGAAAGPHRASQLLSAAAISVEHDSKKRLATRCRGFRLSACKGL
ncbi:hypothetical protein EYF80_001512 [Liparis tanakae]|uniref:Uncharacterized protein n=1 Tax=Liparis tanakae TaxID=230148 RepID=A0A4Z2JDG6_9TELE|nr:hypothetical protein EYF80_001512 [Liparis tanakae]